MISAVQIAFTQQQFELQFQLIRHFLTHPQMRAVRDAFIEKHARAYDAGFQKYLAAKPDRDVLDDLVAPAISSSYRRWLTANLHHLKEFSENRLKQMEIILRYAIFEGFFLKAIGNILWEYPELRKCPIHTRMKPRLLKKSLTPGSQRERIAWTKAAVDAVDRLHFAEWKADKNPSPGPYVWEYLNECLGLNFGHEKHCCALERARRIRNDLVHRGPDLSITDERMDEVVVHLSNFPTVLVTVASKKFPKACTEYPPEEGEDGTPAYILLEQLESYT